MLPQDRFPDIDRMPDFPALPVPDMARLNKCIRQALLDPAGGILRRDQQGNPIFGAYIGSDSNEMITWSIVTLGEWLLGHDTAWLTPTWETFFSSAYGIYLNTPTQRSCELWYLMYANMLASALQQTVSPEDSAVRARFGLAADSMLRMAQTLGYDFNHQSFRFDTLTPDTQRDAYRQPDAIAGYAYNMLFAALHADRPQYMEESHLALQRYQAMLENPWYEIPSGSAGLLAAAWLDSHGYPMDVPRMAGWLFDHDHGPLQIGQWGGEEIDGLMMGWRGNSRAAAMSSAYSMETLMPLQFLLPAVRYRPQLTDAVGKFTRCVLSNFQLFYAQGKTRLYETTPEYGDAVPYERLVESRNGHSPAACGDFFSHRSVYGSAYLLWLEALARPTSDPDIFALDLSLTDWLAKDRLPVFLLRNPFPEPRTISFTPAPIWAKLHPELYQSDCLSAMLWTFEPLASTQVSQTVLTTLPANSSVLVALLPAGCAPERQDHFLCYQGAELCRLD